MKKEITEEENDLIEAIRNHRRSYPNGHPRLMMYAVELFEKMIYD